MDLAITEMELLTTKLDELNVTVTKAWAATLFGFSLLGYASNKTMITVHEFACYRKGGTPTDFDNICKLGQ
jgi:hypothetical protein